MCQRIKADETQSTEAATERSMKKGIRVMKQFEASIQLLSLRCQMCNNECEPGEEPDCEVNCSFTVTDAIHMIKHLRYGESWWH